MAQSADPPVTPKEAGASTARTDVGRIKAEIARTRDRMAASLDAIQERLTAAAAPKPTAGAAPPNVASASDRRPAGAGAVANGRRRPRTSGRIEKAVVTAGALIKVVRVARRTFRSLPPAGAGVVVAGVGLSAVAAVVAKRRARRDAPPDRD